MGYQLGPTGAQIAGERSVQVLPVLNETQEPRLNEFLTRALRKAIQSDGTYRLATQNDGSILLEARVLNYDRGVLTFEPDDTLTPRDTVVVIDVQVTAKRRFTGEMVLDEVIRSRTPVRVGKDLAASERQSLPLMADNLAQNIISLLANGSW